MATIWELVGEFKELYDMLTNPEENQEAVETSLECVQFEFEEKAKDYLYILDIMQADFDAYDARAKAFKAKADVVKNNMDRLKKRLMDAMVATGHDDKAGLKAGDFTIKVVKNGGKTPLIYKPDVKPMDVEANYIKFAEPEFDSEAIRKALDAGEELDFVQYGDRGTHLMIK